MRKILAFLVAALIFVGCSNKSAPEYNKSDIYWYQKMIYYVSNENLDKADEYFTSLQSEHFASPLLKEATLIMAQAHMDNEEYLMAKYYLDLFIKRYADEQDIEFAKYLKIKASFLGFKSINRDQKLLQDTIKESREFKQTYPNSEFVPLVDTILTKLYLAQYVLYENIADLYEKRGKIKAAKIYRSKIKNFWMKKDEIYVPKNWYDYLINW
ncbi:outer membrane protein assembly factor BamD [Nitratiruptor sp. YY09-18]|uniref:outer membrane protein assembly factor BamD n=1 Tax=Nitratiruptor sp. YY09-18 TaxID=2724901 RepID=UPI0019154E40|nr:outer membrane protein assembly factor BamD [Nitratiruptor sp. YY09-18]BCD67664.1 outer membrane protein assembly factor BamD [Nitratiruptor sp. YY09-18]